MTVNEPVPASGWLERLFKLRERGSCVRTEILGGATTFAAMAYIIVVNPAILAADPVQHIPLGPMTVATILTAVVGCLLMGLYANRPLAVAPYMGENAFIAFTLVQLGITFEERLGSVFVSGLAFLAITLLRLRTWLARSISPSMKHSFAAGIGLFLAFIGLYTTGIIDSGAKGMPAAALAGGPDSEKLANQPLQNPPAPVKLGDLKEVTVLLAVAGFTLIAILMCLRVRGAILIGMTATAAAGFALGVGEAPTGVVAVPWAAEYDVRRVAGTLDILGVLRFSFLPILLTLFLVSFLDTLGTLIGVGSAGGMLDEKGDLPEMEKPMLVDAVSCVFAGLIGTSTSGAYIESAAGVKEGARTGLTAVVVAGLFAMCLFFIPLVEPLQKLGYVYGPALIAVGGLMLGSAARIDFSDLTEAVPAYATIVMMIYTFNIANGLTAGLILYPLVKVAAGRGRELHGGAMVLGAVCLVYYLFGLPH